VEYDEQEGGNWNCFYTSSIAALTTKYAVL